MELEPHVGIFEVITLVASLYAAYRVYIWFSIPDLNFPVVGSPDASDYASAVLEGFEQYSDMPFILPSNPTAVILPLSMYMEVKNHSSIHHNLERQTRFMSRWTHADPEKPEIYPTIRIDMAKNMSALLPLIQEETRYGFSELDISSEWKELRIQSTMARLVALITSRAFIGEPLSRKDEWLRLTLNYTSALGRVQNDYNSHHPTLVRFMAPFLTSVRTARQYVKRAEPLLAPLVSSVLSNEEKSMALQAGEPGALISWLLAYLPEKDRTTTRIAIDQLVLAFGAIHNTANTATFAIMNLLEHPEYIDDLRAEIEAEQAKEPAQHGDTGTFFGKTAFANMKKLDSFVKESMRYSGVFTVNPLYVTTANVSFSNGLRLPKGTRVGFPTRGISMSPMNPTLRPTMNARAGNPGPEIFDGYRFEKLRRLPGDEAKHQAVTTGLDSLVWGHGPHACPGRFFAIYEIKSILIEFLLGYDIRTTSTSTEGLLKEVRVGLMSNPHPMATVEIRKRSI